MRLGSVLGLFEDCCKLDHFLRHFHREAVDGVDYTTGEVEEPLPLLRLQEPLSVLILAQCGFHGFEVLLDTFLIWLHQRSPYIDYRLLWNDYTKHVETKYGYMKDLKNMSTLNYIFLLYRRVEGNFNFFSGTSKRLMQSID